MYRIIGADGREYGPISAEQLRQWIAEGRANAQTKVLLEGTTEWKSLGDFPEFLPAAPAAGPVSPGPLPSPPPPMPTYAPAPTAGLDQIQGPAIGLIAVAILGFLIQALLLALNLLGTSIIASQQMPREAWSRMMSGSLGAASNIIAILVSLLILVGGLKMRKLENYGLAMAASIIAMIPCISPCCLVGLPVGIWAVVVLSKPEIKSAFH